MRSHGSLLAGVASPEALVEKALERGYSALALTDRDNLYLAVRFLQAAAKAGLRALPGAELTQERALPRLRDATQPPHGRTAVLLLPVTRRGWANLCALITAQHLDPHFDLVRAVAELHAGLHVIAESPALLTALLAAGVPAAIRADAERARPLLQRGGLWMGVRGLAFERPRLRARLAEAWRMGVPAVATGDIMMLDAADHEAHRVAVTAGAGELLERMSPSAFCPRDAWLAPADEWERRIRATCGGAGCGEAADELLANNAALAERCHVQLEMGTPIFPRAPLPAGVTAEAALRRLAEAGLPRRYATRVARHTAHERLDSELSLIAHMGFTDYFLLVASIVGFARERGIPTVGRGSGASSIVAYLLGVTSVDPIRYGLCFERFLHPQRRDCPDLDVDLCWQRRDEVIGFVYEKYGDDRVAMISTHATLGPRSAFREAAKTLGVPLPRVNALARRVPRGGLGGGDNPAAIEEILAQAEPEFREPRIAEALRLAAKLAGAPRHLGIHCGGLVIGDRPLTHYLPLERSAKGVVVSQFEMRAVEAIGLVKMDLLGNRAITTIGECVTLVSREARAARENPADAGTGPLRASDAGGIDPDAVPETDEATAQVVASGDTLNCFQLESPAMRHLLLMLQARTMDATVAAVALVRPGPAESGMKEAFCRRQRGLEPITYAHPRLERTLRETHGIMLYEEDVMRVASALCGLPLAEGETLRRAIAASRHDEEFRFLERGFLTQTARSGIAEAQAHKVWADLTRFAGYAFCKAHAAGYGRLAWQSTYFKTRYPAAWAVGVLNHHAGMYPTWVHVEDLRRHGVQFLAPCVMASQWPTTLATHVRAGGAVRVGLGRVMGLSHATAERVTDSRERRAFASLADFTDRVRPTPPELEALILSGALDLLGRARAALLLEARVSAAAAPRVKPRAEGALLMGTGAPLAPVAVAPIALPELGEFSLPERVRGEFAASGMWFSAHPLQALLASDTRRGCIDAAAVPAHTGRRVRVCGVPCASRRVEARTAAGGSVLFTTLADESGLVECVLFPKRYAQFAPAMRGEIVIAEGRVDETLGAMTLVVDRARGLGAYAAGGAGGTAHPESAPSRNRSDALNSRAGEAGPPSRYRERGAGGTEHPKSPPSRYREGGAEHPASPAAARAAAAGA